jgi:hypothetical protein
MLSLSKISLELTNALGWFKEKKKFYEDKNRILSDTIQERIEQKKFGFLHNCTYYHLYNNNHTSQSNH